jgi:hypothetical protein
MGRKGTSKRKPKKSKQPAAALAVNSGNSPVQSLIKDKSTTVQSETPKTSGGWNKKKKRH